MNKLLEKLKPLLERFNFLSHRLEPIWKRWKKFKVLWISKTDALLVRSVVAIMIVASATAVTGSFLFLKRVLHPNESNHQIVAHVESAPATEGEHGGGGHEKVEAAAYLQDLPTEVLKAQDGVEELDKDLADPKIEESRTLASLAKSDLKVKKAYRFVNFFEVFGNTRPSSDGKIGGVAMDVALEVDSYEAETEINAVGAQVYAKLGALTTERTSEELATVDGKYKFKKDIAAALQPMLKNGRITDVLFMNMVLK